MELGLKGRVAAITGGSKGIGKAIARGLAAEGVNLVLLSRGKEALDKAAEEIRKEYGVKVLAVATDITSAESVKAAAAAAKSEFGAVHIVINNAGGPIGGWTGRSLGRIRSGWRTSTSRPSGCCG